MQRCRGSTGLCRMHAGDIAARHTGLDQRSLVTAAIDRISWMGVPHSSCTPWVSSARHINPVVNNTSSSGLASGSSRASAQSTVAGPTALPTTPYTLGNGQEAVCMSSSTDGRDGLDAVEPIISLFRDLRLAGQVGAMTVPNGRSCADCAKVFLHNIICACLLRRGWGAP